MQRQEAIGFFLGHRLALTTELFEPRPVQHRDGPPVLRDYAELLQRILSQRTSALRSGSTASVGWVFTSLMFGLERPPFEPDIAA